MISIINRFNKHKEDHIWLRDPASSVQREAECLSQKLQHLQESYRQLMGEELSGLDTNQLKNLESQMQIGLNSVRMQKDQMFTDEIEELQEKGSFIHLKNEELHTKIDLIHEQNAELQKGYGKRKGNTILHMLSAMDMMISLFNKASNDMGYSLTLKLMKN
ncbi:unnamed protein product [Sphenostylis stenocarpa]|uniref:K-box domain-containing protein n=1 Tax=Sphenostylis stenocarpa TaxID=92480 RepID=A0AA86S5Q3_9FABA|nr:unnamed protein product [Sphenostylis stenocarpa]